jgi:hypothetical protein
MVRRANRGVRFQTGAQRGKDTARIGPTQPRTSKGQKTGGRVLARYRLKECHLCFHPVEVGEEIKMHRLEMRWCHAACVDLAMGDPTD